jgi:acetyl/propionyl-CoA carboxylase alpha subunit/acetyl-CoA carboxylase carboxyltransferase component
VTNDSPPLRCIAIANRGEPALRCLRTVKSLRAREGSELTALALFTEPDRAAPFVRHADRTLELPAPRGPRAAYLDADAVIAAALRGGADAVWPGWGFLAEDPDFADRVEAAGLRFLGPSGDVMRRLGDKVEAKRLAERLGVPVAKWSGEALADLDAAAKVAEAVGYPLLAKAAAGGGGRGIRVVETAEQLAEAFRGASDEARSAFGDARVYLERRIERGRHIEVQIAADAHGNAVALGCRECSVQRRHQKLIEETPPPGLTPALLAQLSEAALALVRAVEYRGVGTVEFLVAGDVFYFLEVNPRLQVEHGITEETTGVDLVEWQIRIARGERLPSAAPKARGVAIEARICAEDPAEGFRPAPGRVVHFDPALGPRVRVDSGVAAGTLVPPDFDSLIAKVIATGETRDEARARLVAALRDFEVVIEGGATNRGYLVDLLETPALRAGAVDTAWLEREGPPPRPAPDGRASAALVAAAILAYQRTRLAARRTFYADASNVALSRVPPSIGQQIDLVHAGASYRLQVFAVGAWRYRVIEGGVAVSATWRGEGAHAAHLRLGGRALRVLHDANASGARVQVEGFAGFFAWQGVGQVRASAPALVVALHVAEGDRVEAGEALGVLEAMKTEVAFHAPVSGIVGEVRVVPGRQVAAGDVLLVIEAVDDASAPTTPRIAVQREPDALDAREEIRRLLLGYDWEPERGERLLAFLEAPLPEAASPELLRELAELRHELAVFADVETLFVRTPHNLRSGAREPSNLARLRAFVRRMEGEGAGIAEPFLALLRRAFAHYGVATLAPSDALERALLRLFATPGTRALRHRLARALVHRVESLVDAGVSFRDDTALRDALDRVAELRGLVSDELADAAIEARAAAFEDRASEPETTEGAAPLAEAAFGGRLADFELERLPSRAGNVAFHARHREVPSDERVFVLAEARSQASGSEARLHVPAFERAFYEAARTLRGILLERDPQRRLQWNRIFLVVGPELFLDPATAAQLARRLAPATRHLRIEKVVVRLGLLDRDAPGAPAQPMEIVISDPTGTRLDVSWRDPQHEALRAATDTERRVVEARRRRLVYPYEIISMLTTPGGDLPAGGFEEYELAPGEAAPRAVPVARPPGGNPSAVVFGAIGTLDAATGAVLRRVLLLSDPTREMGALAAPECDRIVAAIDLAERLGVPLEWVPVSAGARIALDSGTENLDATARVARRIIEFTRGGGVIHLVVHGVCVGAQSYWNALATMLGDSRGALVMTPNAAMVLTGRAALEASGAVAAEDEVAIGGFERVMGPNGEAQYFARDLGDAYRILYQHYRYTYVVPGESRPRLRPSDDPSERSICDEPYPEPDADGFAKLGDVFDAAQNGERKRPFSMRALMNAVVDRDGGHLERWSAMAGGETAIVWDAQLGGFPTCVIGIESRSVAREGYHPPDGPASWSGGTLFPLSSKKVARALRAASGNRPVVVLANLSGFDGSPESMRKLQLEYGAEIARAVVEFEGPLVFLVVSRYHGGAYVVFSRALNPGLHAAAIEGSFASVIGGGPAAAVVFTRELRAAALADPRVAKLRASGAPHEDAFADVLAEKQAELAARFDGIHSVERAQQVGSLHAIVPAPALRPYLIATIAAALA